MLAKVVMCGMCLFAVEDTAVVIELLAQFDDWLPLPAGYHNPVRECRTLS